MNSAVPPFRDTKKYVVTVEFTVDAPTATGAENDVRAMMDEAATQYSVDYCVMGAEEA